jgi:hypothetical protein
VEALWRAWDHLRLDGAIGTNVCWKDHADHHMRVLRDPRGPFYNQAIAVSPRLKDFMIFGPTYVDQRQHAANIPSGICSEQRQAWLKYLSKLIVLNRHVSGGSWNVVAVQIWHFLAAAVFL